MSLIDFFAVGAAAGAGAGVGLGGLRLGSLGSWRRRAFSRRPPPDGVGCGVTVDAGTTMVADALGSAVAEVTVAPVGATTVGDGAGLATWTLGLSPGGSLISAGAGANCKGGAAGPRATTCGRGTSVGDLGVAVGSNVYVFFAVGQAQGNVDFRPRRIVPFIAGWPWVQIFAMFQIFATVRVFVTRRGQCIARERKALKQRSPMSVDDETLPHPRAVDDVTKIDVAAPHAAHCAAYSRSAR